MSQSRPSSHPLPESGVPNPETWRLRVEGMVERPLELTLADLERLGRIGHTGTFTCVRGWEPGELNWEGAPLTAVLALATPRPDATALYAYAPGYRALVPLGAVAGAMLATRLDGERLAVERGAPCRLVVPDRSCQLSMKWVERLELFTRASDQEVGPRRPA